MKVLVAHNRYVSDNPSGENQVVDAEIELLEKAGVEVVPMIESSDSLKGASKRRMLEAGLGPLYAPGGVARFRRLLETERPDVVHLHNPIPLISPWVIRVAHAAGIPVVQTVHNYRHSCVNGLHFRDGRTCTDCTGKLLPLPAMQHGCYRDSKLQTVPVALGQVLHRPTWQLVSRFLALTPFMAQRLQQTGIPADRITLRPSWVPDAGPVSEPGTELLFVGRLDEAKGVRLLLDAWRIAGPGSDRILCIAGDGPMRAEVEAAAAASGRSIRYEGWVSAAKVVELMDRCAAVIVPSLWFEGYPLVIAQAFGRGRAVLTVSGGSAASIVDEAVGWIAGPATAELAAALSAISTEQAMRRGRQARARYEIQNSVPAAVESLLRVYGSSRGTGSGPASF